KKLILPGAALIPVCSKTSDTVFLLSNNVAMVVMLRWRNAFRFNGKSR
ncbi:hypothetical protein Pgy4_38468, partial [Pseudomonas savastanoi pv. glycinea str. race 4]